MAILLRFPTLHGRASAILLAGVSRAASSASSSASTPAARAHLVPVSELHHSEGMLSRCHHLRTAGTVAPTSSANASLDDQRPITLRKVRGRAFMSSGLGQTVPKSKAKVSRDDMAALVEYAAMTDRMTEAEEKAFFIGRTKAARLAKYATQKEICILLDLDQGTYKQYETRTPLPLRFIPKFCAAVGVSLEWLLTGEGKGPRREEYIRWVPKRVAQRARTKAA